MSQSLSELLESRMGGRAQGSVANDLKMNQGLLSDWLNRDRVPRKYPPEMEKVLQITKAEWNSAVKETKDRRKIKKKSPDVPVLRSDRSVMHIAKLLIDGDAQDFTEMDLQCLSDIELRIGKMLSPEVAISVLNLLHPISGE